MIHESGDAPILVALGVGFLAFAALIPAILGGVAQVVAQLQFGRQGDARQVAPVLAIGSEGGDLVDFAAPQDHVVVAAEGEGEGGAPGAGSENGDTHGA